MANDRADLTSVPVAAPPADLDHRMRADLRLLLGAQAQLADLLAAEGRLRESGLVLACCQAVRVLATRVWGAAVDEGVAPEGNGVPQPPKGDSS